MGDAQWDGCSGVVEHPASVTALAIDARIVSDVAPWYVVPADKKWYARLAVMNLLIEHLEELDPQWPEVDFDVEEQKQLLAET